MTGKVNGIVFEEGGLAEGVPVVFIHSFPSNRTMWEPQREVLQKTCRFISYDVRGFGESEVGDGRYTLELFVDDLMGLLDHLKIRKAVLCGLSMGGYIALRAAERHPERLSGLVLCDTKSGADSDEAKLKRTATLRAIKKNGVAPFADAFVKTVLTENTLQTKPKVVESLLRSILGNSSTGICGALLAMAARTDTTAALSTIHVPTLVLVGAEDKLTPPSAAQALQKVIPHATLHVIPQAAHMSNLENPSVFNEKLLLFLSTYLIHFK